MTEQELNKPLTETEVLKLCFLLCKTDSIQDIYKCKARLIKEGIRPTQRNLKCAIEIHAR